MEFPELKIKVVLLGESGVGKSSLFLRFVSGTFKTDSDNTAKASFIGKRKAYGERTVRFNVWDTAGQEQYKFLMKLYYRDANAAILVYDITDPESYARIQDWYKELTEYGPRDIILIIAGNKEDLIGKEAVSIHIVQEYADLIGASFVKTSAKTNCGVEKLFNNIAKRFYPDLTSVSSDSVLLVSNPSVRSRKKCC